MWNPENMAVLSALRRTSGELMRQDKEHAKKAERDELRRQAVGQYRRPVHLQIKEGRRIH